MVHRVHACIYSGTVFLIPIQFPQYLSGIVQAKKKKRHFSFHFIFLQLRPMPMPGAVPQTTADVVPIQSKVLCSYVGLIAAHDDVGIVGPPTHCVQKVGKFTKKKVHDMELPNPHLKKKNGGAVSRKRRRGSGHVG
jgi:hypothetical protein